MRHVLLLALLLATAPALALDGNAEEGRIKSYTCTGCHGIDGYRNAYPEYHVPKIHRQNREYIVAALNAYRAGERTHPTMRAQGESLSDQDIADISAYYEQHGKGGAAVPEQAAPAPSDVAALLTKGACASCHGANYSKPIDPAYPKIAGQHADYLFVALKAYKTEGAATLGRGNPIMAAQVKQFTLPQLRQIAEYLGSLPGELRTVKEGYFR